jgi:hypothetical protein
MLLLSIDTPVSVLKNCALMTPAVIVSACAWIINGRLLSVASTWERLITCSFAVETGLNHPHRTTRLPPPARIVTDPGPEYAALARRFQGIPSLARSPKGRLWATWYGGKTRGEYARCLRSPAASPPRRRSPQAFLIGLATWNLLCRRKSNTGSRRPMISPADAVER